MTFQAKLVTKFEKYSVQDAILELTNDTSRDQLNDIVKSLLKQAGTHDDSNLKGLSFDFLVGGKFLQTSVEKHLTIYSDEINPDEILNEKLVAIEYLLSLEAPEPLEAVPHDDWVSCVDANESYIISGSYDNSIRIFSLHDKKGLIIIKDAHEKPVTKVKWLKPLDGQKKSDLHFVSTGHDEVSILRKFNTKTLKIDVVSVFTGHNRSVNCIDFSDDLIATGSFDKTLRLWTTSYQADENLNIEDVQDDENSDKSRRKKQKTKSKEKSVSKHTRGAILTLTGHQESVTGIKWLGDCNDYKSLATCSMDRTICIWDVEVGECKRRVLSSKPLLGIDYCKENSLILSASCDRHIRAWDARAPDNASAKTAYTSHTAWVSSVAFGKSSNNFISGGYDNVVKLWDLRSPKASLYDLIGHHDKVLDVNWQNPGYILSGSADSTLKIFANKHKQ